MIVSVDQAVEQCNLFVAHSLIEGYIQAAQSIAESFLNRRVFSDQAELDAERGAVAEAMAVAHDAYKLAVDTASSLLNPVAKATAMDIAEVSYADAALAANPVIHGMVANPAIVTAVLIIVSDLNENRESTISGAQAEVPQSAQNILRRFRRVMMP